MISSGEFTYHVQTKFWPTILDYRQINSQKVHYICSRWLKTCQNVIVINSSNFLNEETNGRIDHIINILGSPEIYHGDYFGPAMNQIERFRPRYREVIEDEARDIPITLEIHLRDFVLLYTKLSLVQRLSVKLRLKMYLMCNRRFRLSDRDVYNAFVDYDQSVLQLNPKNYLIRIHNLVSANGATMSSYIGLLKAIEILTL
ncbi:hypothetical protein DFJ63DRAFT_126985 [Scheffersomyces coipomensis]|uniref:uncharacterized protein n=1 Tax=Scheffersomyces coipomensis TaxID=1788519 RepID=UPI00315C8742